MHGLNGMVHRYACKKLIVCCLQTFLTSISLSAIATNGVVQSEFLRSITLVASQLHVIGPVLE